jgi:glycerol uptake facilitator-like aquaporin
MMQIRFAASPAQHLWLSALAGAVLAAIFALVFWATATAQALPPQTPEIIRSFTPEQGLAALVSGLLWSAAAGAFLALTVAAAYLYGRGPRSGSGPTAQS